MYSADLYGSYVLWLSQLTSFERQVVNSIYVFDVFQFGVRLIELCFTVQKKSVTVQRKCVYFVCVILLGSSIPYQEWDAERASVTWRAFLKQSGDSEYRDFVSVMEVRDGMIYISFNPFRCYNLRSFSTLSVLSVDGCDVGKFIYIAMADLNEPERDPLLLCRCNRCCLPVRLPVRVDAPPAPIFSEHVHPFSPFSGHGISVPLSLPVDVQGQTWLMS